MVVFAYGETPENNSMAFFGGVFFFFEQNWRTHTVVRYPTVVISQPASQSVSQYIVLAHTRPRRIEKSHICLIKQGYLVQGQVGRYHL